MPSDADLIRPQPIDRFAGEENRAVVGPERAGEHVENRGFAGAVGTDESDDRAFFDFEGDVCDRA